MQGPALEEVLPLWRIPLTSRLSTPPRQKLLRRHRMSIRHKCFALYRFSPPNRTASAFSCADAKSLRSELPDGGVHLSVLSPDDAVSWLESHYDDPLLESLRARNFQGPVAVKLSAEESALAIFGSIADALVPQLARTLAQVSGFAVMVRSSIDNPIPSFTKPASDSERKETPRSLSVDQPAARLRGGAPDPQDNDDERQTTPKWEGKYHSATVNLTLKMEQERAYDVRVSSFMKVRSRPRIFPVYVA
jgi:hypothetical protein